MGGHIITPELEEFYIEGQVNETVEYGPLTYDGEPVENAILTIITPNENVSGVTNSNGLCNFIFNSPVAGLFKLELLLENGDEYVAEIEVIITQ